MLKLILIYATLNPSIMTTYQPTPPPIFYKINQLKRALCWPTKLIKLSLAIPHWTDVATDLVA